MKHVLSLSLAFLLAIGATSQIQNVDSLKNVLNTQKLTDKAQLDIYLELCDIYFHNDMEEFDKYSEEGFQQTLKVNDKSMLADFYKYKGLGFESYGKVDSAIFCYKKGLELALETNNKKCEGNIYRYIANIHVYNREYMDNQVSLEYYLKALQTFESIGDKKNTVLALNSIGEYHRMLKNLERANYYAEKAKAIADEIDYDYGRMCIYYNLAGIVNNTDSTISYTFKALDIAKKLGDKKGEIYSLQNLTYDYCLEKKEYGKAEKYGLECLRLAEEFGETSSLTCAWTALSYVYLYQGRFDDCKTMVLKAWEADSLNVQLSTLTNLAAAYLYSGEVDKAHTFFVNYVHFMEEHGGKQFQKSIADMETKYETEKKEMRISSLEKERQLYIWLGLAGLLFAAALGIVLWQKIKSAQKEKQLIATRSVLDGEMGERMRLARDLHDRLSGNLSAVKIELNNNTDSVQNVSNKLDSCIEEVRRVAHNLMPTSLQYGMKVALEDFVAQFPNVQFHFFGEEKRIEEREEFVIYCCASELVNNAIRHSGAKNINVQLVQDEKHVSLTVQDDGCGFDEKVAVKGIGLKNIRDRVASCNGKMDITTSPGKGTEIIIELKTKKA